MTAQQIQETRLENASNSAQGNFYSSPSGFIESTNPLHNPEIRTEIGRYLKKSALACCASVCWEWNRTFTPLLYSIVEITKMTNTNPPIETFRRNKSFIKSMAITTDTLDSKYSHLLMPNLETLKLHLKDSSNNTEPMIQNHKNIRSLDLSCVSTNDKIMFWESVASLPHLEELTIRDQYGHETDTMWDICSSRLKKLNIFNSQFRGLLAFTGTGTSSIGTADFHLLRDLTISKCGFHATIQPVLIMKCQNLERLVWKIDLFDRGTTTEIATLFQGFTEILASGKWPNIKSLAVGFNLVSDAAYAEFVRALNNRTLEEFDVSMTQFGELAFSALKCRFSTLRVLNIRKCPNLTSANVLEILASCPHLQSLTVDRIYAQYLDPNQEWPCRKTLQSLSIEFELGQEPKLDEPSAATVMETKPQKLNEIVFTCLGQLRELKHLSINYHELDIYSRQNGVVSIPLEIQLSKGLGELVGLKRLSHFSMGVLTDSLGPGEVDWMLRNWSNLDILEGFSNSTTEIPMERAVKQKGITIKLNT
ncbi:hypothetical protein BGZ80_007331 [Entomortierella chlamydospora]|uniref:RNI-like protein n=1 Tax=Entomortierella chlamydospora TaxID=101097 RepID=A0A9P6T1N1_9FUNG|nr:hypothetical protein BGZ79_009593 [Entomortierella chlamydospora]KAG0018311.1 hypothetical protein BGZ80_007331 [Entomortierella chlamydospora]